MPGPATRLSRVPAPGLTLVEGGADFSVYASHATAVQVCLWPEGGGPEERVELPQRSQGWWYGHLPGVGPGTRYGLRVDGPWDPQAGHRHNPAKLLLDPYARAIEGEVTWSSASHAHVIDPDCPDDTALRSDLDNADLMPRCVVVDERFDWGDDRPPAFDESATIAYEAHVREMTMRHPGVPEHLRGTYAGLAHPAMTDHLRRLGVTTVELLPVHAFTHEPHLVERGLTNHWGYNTLGFFAPHAAYAAATDPQGVLDEFKGMVKLLHAAGLEVVLDVVYNHTAEQSVRGPVLSWRGLDAATYYRLDDRGHDVDVTGCGGTVDLRDPAVARMVLDSLRYWVTECHVDGFRFDLAVALARGPGDEFDPEHPFLMALRTDPVLARTRLVAEPWDLGPNGWRTGQFPPNFSEWNDRFRDAARTFWLTDLARLRAGESTGHGVSELASRLAGSEDVFGAQERGPQASVNFVAAHDGFTLADLTTYNHKHNTANGEDNRDGTDTNRSWNHGVEGPTHDPSVQALRRRSMRNLLGTLLLSAGTPMITAGDELGRSTAGNNNPYCQDNELTWIDWDLESWQEDLLVTTAQLVRLRRENPTLRQHRFFTGDLVDDDGSTDLAWYDEHGRPMGDDWGNGERRTLQMYLAGGHLGHEGLLVVVHGSATDGQVVLPSPPGATGYRLLWDSAWERPWDGGGHAAPGQTVGVSGGTMRLYLADDPT